MLGDSLVGLGDVQFDGHAAPTLEVRAGGREGLTHISPIHGDRRKAGFTDFELISTWMEAEASSPDA